MPFVKIKGKDYNLDHIVSEELTEATPEIGQTTWGADGKTYTGKAEFHQVGTKPATLKVSFTPASGLKDLILRGGDAETVYAAIKSARG